MNRDYDIRRTPMTTKVDPINRNTICDKQNVQQRSSSLTPSKNESATYTRPPLSSTAMLKSPHLQHHWTNRNKVNKENFSPRAWRNGSVAENVARRVERDHNRRKVSFTEGENLTNFHNEFIYQENEGSIEVIDFKEGNENNKIIGLISEKNLSNDMEISMEEQIPDDNLRQKTEEEKGTRHEDTFTSPDRPIMSRTDAEAELVTSERMYHPPTKLHEICNSAKEVCNLTSFLRAPNVRGRNLSSAAAKDDSKGKLPMHVLSENHSLASSLFTPSDFSFDEINDDIVSKMSSFALEGTSDKSLKKFFLEVLLPANPFAIIAEDHDGYIPFERSLSQWTRRMHTQHEQSKRSLFSISSRRRNAATRRVRNAWISTSLSIGTNFTWTGQSLQVQHNNEDPSEIMEHGASVIGREENTFSFPENVRLTSLVRFSIKMLSLILDQLDYSTNQKSTKSSKRMKTEFRSNDYNRSTNNFLKLCQSKHAEDIADHIIEVISSIPNLLLTVFLLNDNSEREWVLSSSLFRYVILHHSSVGPWINATLQHSEKSIAQRGLNYLSHVSSVIETSKDSAARRFHENILEAVSKLNGFIPSLLALEERQIETAATTLIVKSVLDEIISRPFAIAVVFFDFCFLCILMVGFRYSVYYFLTGKGPEVILRWIYLANTGIFYFIIRELGKSITLLERTRKAKIYLWSFWNIADILSTMLALCSTVVLRVTFSRDIDFDDIKSLRALLAITTGLLWLRALSLLKSLNIHLATFVLAILQICKDVIWFLVIIGSLVASFSQMFYTILLPSSCAVTEDAATRDPQCSQAEYYLRVYTIMGDLGEFDRFRREEFNTAFSVFLLVLFSFMVVIILLNVLIAIVCDSYEKCLVRSHYLFGRARVLLVAELVSFQNLLRTHTEFKVDSAEAQKSCIPEVLWNRGWSGSSIAFFCLSALVIFVWFLGETSGFASSKHDGSFLFSFLSVLVNILLFAAIVAFLSRSAEGMEESRSVTPKDEAKLLFRCYNYIQQYMKNLLGSSQDSLFRKGEMDDWRGRAHYLRTEMELIAKDNKYYMEDQIKHLEQKFYLSESNVRSQIANLEESMSKLRGDVMLKLLEIEDRNGALLEKFLGAINQE